MIECLVIVFLTFRIFNKKLVLGEAVVAPIKKESVVLNKKSKYKYYYEPKANTVKQINADWGPYNGKYTINDDTLVERYNYELKKPEKTYRIITLGDSYTFGLYVDTPDNWPEQLEDLFKNEMHCQGYSKFEVINLGVQGYDIQWEVERFLLKGIKYNPDLVLWLIKDDDVIQVNETMFEKMSHYPRGVRDENWFRGMEETFNELGEKKTREIQQRAISDYMDFYKGKTIFITFPNKGNFPYDIIGDILDENKERTDFMYLEDIYKDNQDYYANDFHPTPKGHVVIAQNIFDYLTRTKIIPCD